MIASGANKTGAIVGAVAVTLFYAVFFWRIYKNNRGSKVVECGVLAIMLMLAMAFLSGAANLPDWAWVLLIALLFLLCMLTLLFVAQRAYGALRKRKSGAKPTPASFN